MHERKLICRLHPQDYQNDTCYMKRVYGNLKEFCLYSPVCKNRAKIMEKLFSHLYNLVSRN